jgi:hypothetical protein
MDGNRIVEGGWSSAEVRFLEAVAFGVLVGI